MFSQLIYRSTAALPRGHITDIDILRESIRGNTPLGITGYLLRSSQSFLQGIEGSPDAISTVFAKIRSDKRHSNIYVFTHEMRAERDFSQWDMGYAEIGSDGIISQLTNGEDARTVLLNCASEFL